MPMRIVPYPHRVAGETATLARRNRAISLVDERRQILSDERLPVSGGRRVRNMLPLLLVNASGMTTIISRAPAATARSMESGMASDLT